MVLLSILASDARQTREGTRCQSVAADGSADQDSVDSPGLEDDWKNRPRPLQTIAVVAEEMPTLSIDGPVARVRVPTLPSSKSLVRKL